MATTCDYCHKPLSLMRRLRGEQFCSVEHLDLYTAQQSEVALQRLAASLDEKPIQQRPPALLKRIAKTPVQATSNGSHKTVVEEAPSQEYMRLGEDAPSRPAPPALRAEPTPTPVQAEPELPDYPVAPFAPQPQIQARAPKQAAPPRMDQEHSEAPVQSWKPRLAAEPVFTPPVALAEAPAAANRIEVTLNPAKAPKPDLLARPVDLPAEITAPSPDISTLRSTEADLLFQPPELAGPRTASLRLLSVHFKPAGLADFEPILNFDAALGADLGGVPMVSLPTSARILLMPGMVAAVPADEFTSTEPLPAGDLAASWPAPQTLAAPLLAATPNFNIAQPPLRSDAAAQRLAALEPVSNPVTPRLRDVHARFEPRLNTGHRQPQAAWANPRIDSTILDPGVADSAHPAPAPAGVRIAPLAASVRASLPLIGPSLLETNLQQEPGPLASAPDSWKFPDVDPQPVITLEPAAGLALGPISQNIPYSLERPAALPDLEPVRYSPATLVTLPRPDYRPLPPGIATEGRFVALAPNGIYRLPKLQHTGYRMPGPYPKVPAHMPALSGAPAATVPPPDFDLPIIWTWTRDTGPGVPSLEAPVPARLHPADFFAWPAFKIPRTDRILPLREADSVLGPAAEANPTPRRFGPARAGLQHPLKGADLKSSTGA